MRLFHYTSINNLALILKNRKIRFSCLNIVNDRLEGQTSDFGDLGQYVFVSCWTENAEESFPLWNMYTNMMRGVRIELEDPIFKLYSIGEDTEGKILFPIDKLVAEQDNFIIMPPIIDDYKIKVDYTDDESKLNPNIREVKGIQIDRVGRCKKKIWAFEQEWRFRFNIFPLSDKISGGYIDRYSYSLQMNESLPISFYDIDIDNEIFQNMKLLKGPKNSPGDSEIIESLVKTYNPTAIIDESAFTNLIR